jgi:hypothetical protein
MDPIKILKRAWHILWSYRALWVFGLILALAAGGSSGNSSNSSDYQSNNQGTSEFTPQSMQEVMRGMQDEMQKLFDQGIPDMNVTGKELVAFLWVFGAFLLVMVIFGVVMTIARYVSETAVIRMVDEYEASETKMTVMQGFRIGWSKTSWRLFLINLIVNLPAITLMLVLLIAGIGVYFAWVNGTVEFAAFSTVATVVLLVITIFVVIILSIVLNLLRNFFWRASVLEDLGVRESFSRGFAMVRENWKDVGLMWLVMIGLGIIWMFASVLLFIVTIPVVIVTAVLAALVASVPFLLFAGIFSLFTSGWLVWIAAGLFVAPLFFTIAFSPWVLLGSWQMVYTSTVWTLTYRELKALPALEITPEPVAS